MSRRLTIENCDLKFEYKCPLKWSKLKATGNAKIKFCDDCKSSVYRCDSPEEIDKHIEMGHCIAVKGNGIRMPMGMMVPPEINLKALERAGSRTCKQCGDVVMYCTCYEDVIDK